MRFVKFLKSIMVSILSFLRKEKSVGDVVILKIVNQFPPYLWIQANNIWYHFGFVQERGGIKVYINSNLSSCIKFKRDCP